MKIQIIDEHRIQHTLHTQIQELLRGSFPEYPERSYYKLLPRFRYLVWIDDRLVAHMGVEHRVVDNAGSIVKIFGIIDFCVMAAYRSRKIATTLLDEIDALARSSDIDFTMLFADDNRVYLSNGYQRTTNTCRWVRIDEHRTLDVSEKSFDDCLLVRQTGDIAWKPGPVDMLGYIF
jgi:GNAT superfamily N-acetyltransferase